MTRTMYDALSTQLDAIPADAELVAGYIDEGPHPAAPAWTAEDFARFPHAVLVRIATQPHTNDGHVLDVESGNATPDQAPPWVTMRRAAGVHPTVYCSEADWPVLRAQFAAQGVAEPEWWIAGYPGSVGEGSLYPGSVAHQYGGPASGAYDLSIVADYWPGVDPPPTPPKKRGTAMELLISPTRALSHTAGVLDAQFPNPTVRSLNGIPDSAAQFLAANPGAQITKVGEATYDRVLGKLGEPLLDLNALANAIAAKLPAGSLTAEQVHAELIAVLHSAN